MLPPNAQRYPVLAMPRSTLASSRKRAGTMKRGLRGRVKSTTSAGNVRCSETWACFMQTWAEWTTRGGAVRELWRWPGDSGIGSEKETL